MGVFIMVVVIMSVALVMGMFVMMIVMGVRVLMFVFVVRRVVVVMMIVAYVNIEFYTLDRRLALPRDMHVVPIQSQLLKLAIET